MIELDLKGAGWPSRALAAVACHFQMAERPSRIRFHVACLQGSREVGSREVGSREGISRRAMRLSVRHLSGLIYDAVDDFVRGPNVTGPAKRNHSPRCECASNARHLRRIIL
jgi:hypothetical protein